MFLFFYNSIIFYYELYFYYFYYEQCPRAHINSTPILLFNMNSAPGPHMNSAPPGPMNSAAGPRGAATHGSAPNLGALVYVLGRLTRDARLFERY